MKALVVTPYYHPKIGGLEVYARQLGIALHELKHWEIVVVTSNHQSRRTAIDIVDGMKVYRLGTWLKFSNTPLNPLWPIMMRSVIRTQKPDVILAHTPVPSLADAAALAAGKTPLVVVYHAATLLKKNTLMFNTIVRAYRLYERILLTRANRIIAVSDFVKQQFPRSLQSKTVVVPNSVWERQIITRVQPTRPNFLFVGSLDRTHSWKGLRLIIEAFAEYRRLHGKDCTLTIMGEGNERKNYEALVKSLQLTRSVTFLGNKTGSEKNTAFRKATALVVYPTTANDAFPTVILEAWANEVPVIAAAIGAIPSLITDQQDGYLVEPHNIQALAEALHTVVQTKPSQRQALVARARVRTHKNYTWEQQASVVAKLVKGLL